MGGFNLGVQQKIAKNALDGFGSRLAEKRTLAGYHTIESLANELGIKKSTVSRWEQGTSKPNFEKLIIVADLLNTSCQYLLTGDDPDHMEASKKYGLSNKALKVLESLNVERPVYPGSGPSITALIRPVDLIDALLVSKAPINWASVFETFGSPKDREAGIQMYRKHEEHSQPWIEGVAEDALMLAEQINVYRPAKSSAFRYLEKAESPQEAQNAVDKWHERKQKIKKTLRGYGAYLISENDYFVFQKQLIENELIRWVKATLDKLWTKKAQPENKEAKHGEKGEQ